MVISWKTTSQSGAGQSGRRLVITQGEFQVADDPHAVISTVLGSCVAACVRDPKLGIGGMNHFVLPAPMGRSTPDKDLSRYGYYLMEQLICALLERGGSLRRMEAKVFGGARSLHCRSTVGERNIDFAMKFLMAEGIAVVESQVGGSRGSKLDYWPVSGKSLVALVPNARDDRQATPGGRPR